MEDLEIISKTERYLFFFSGLSELILRRKNGKFLPTYRVDDRTRFIEVYEQFNFTLFISCKIIENKFLFFFSNEFLCLNMFIRVNCLFTFMLKQLIWIVLSFFLPHF